MSIATEFAERLKRVREARGVSRDELAYECGVSVAAIRSSELGSSEPSVVTVIRMARKLDVSLDYLCLGMVGQSFKHTQTAVV